MRRSRQVRTKLGSRWATSESESTCSRRVRYSLSSTLSPCARQIISSFSISTGHQYTHPVHSNKKGPLQNGSWGYKVTWAHYQRVGSCGVKTIGSGKAILPTSETGWKFWETSS